MLTYAGCSSIPVAQCHTGPGGSLDREAFAATSHIVTAPTGRRRHARSTRCEAAQGSGLTEAGISIDALGGAVDDLGATDTAFGHRGALATVQYTATYASGPATRRRRYVRGFRAAMTPSWGQGAYVNYADASLKGYRADYFGGNASRLAQVRAGVRPPPLLHPAAGLLTQPSSSSTQAGTSCVAGPSRQSWTCEAVALAARFSSTVRAPCANARAPRPAAG